MSVFATKRATLYLNAFWRATVAFGCNTIYFKSFAALGIFHSHGHEGWKTEMVFLRVAQMIRWQTDTLFWRRAGWNEWNSMDILILGISDLNITSRKLGQQSVKTNYFPEVCNIIWPANFLEKFVQKSRQCTFECDDRNVCYTLCTWR